MPSLEDHYIFQVRGRFRKTANWSPDMGVNYTMTSEEIVTQMNEKLANRTLRVVTTPVKYFQNRKLFLFNKVKTCRKLN